MSDNQSTAATLAILHQDGFSPILRSDVKFFKGAEPQVVVVFDPSTGRRHQLYEIECMLAQEMDGAKDLDQLTERAELYFQDVDRNKVEQLVIQFGALGLIQNLPAEPLEALVESNPVNGSGIDFVTFREQLVQELKVGVEDEGEGTVVVEQQNDPFENEPTVVSFSVPTLEKPNVTRKKPKRRRMVAPPVSELDEEVERRKPGRGVSNSKALVPSVRPRIPMVRPSSEPSADALSSALGSLRMSHQPEPPKKSGALKTIIILIILGGLGFAGYTVGYPLVAAKMFTTQVALTEVSMVSPVQGAVSVSATGYAVAQNIARVGVKVTGRLIKVAVKEGDHVTAGAELAEIDAADQRSAISTAESRVMAAIARSATAQANLADIRQQAARQKLLVDKQAGMQATLDDLRARARSSEMGVKAANAEVQAIRSEVNTMRVNLQHTKISAPIDGTVVGKPAEIGQLVGPASGYIMEIADFGSLVIETDVPEARIHIVKVGAPCEVVLDAFPTKRYRGQTLEIGSKINRAKATVTVKVKLVDKVDGLLPDMSARVSFLTQALTEKAMKEAPKKVVPTNAVVERGGAKIVFVVNSKGNVQSTPVTLGPTVGSSGFELLEGPAAGTRVVADPPKTLEDGAPVKEKAN